MADQLEKQQFLKSCGKAKVFGSSIQKIVCSTFFVDSGTIVRDLADELNINLKIPVVAVTDDRGLIGIISRVRLFDTLGRAYGREIFGKKRVEEICYQTRNFKASDTIFMVAEELEDHLTLEDVAYYTITDKQNNFTGIFSSKDLLIYLADMTRQDIHMARMLHERLMKENDSLYKQGFEVETYSKSAGILGGDFYYMNTRNSRKWFATLCDVSGKGVSASLITSLLWGMVTMLDPGVPLRGFIKKLNQRIISTFHLEKYLTGIFLNIYPENGRISICDMGHSLIYLIREDTVFNLAGKQGNVPVGITMDLEPGIFSVILKEGDLLLMLTDGLIEQTDIHGEEYSLKQLLSIVKKSSKEPLKDISKRLVKSFKTHKKGVPQHDDTTFVLIRRHLEGAEAEPADTGSEDPLPEVDLQKQETEDS